MYLYNSLSGKKDLVSPIEAGKIKLYVCGLTVYDSAHVGHLRTMLVFDLLVRSLRSQQYEVTYIRNITDVDDKIINRANELGVSTSELTCGIISEISAQERVMGLVEPTVEPKASEYIDKMISLILLLEKKGYSYVSAHGDVCFSVAKYPDYGHLSGQNTEALIKAHRISDLGKEASTDFVLWKLSKPQEPSWDSPWGQGRPGWHIECSAMAGELLGDNFDIHGGGIDLKFPHHENERAQSCAATGGGFANHWMHVGHLHVNDEKMSKSLGNFITIQQALNQYHPEVLKLFLLKTHYSQPFNYTEYGLMEAQTVLTGFYLAIWGAKLGILDESSQHWQLFQQALADDLNVSKGLATMHQLVTLITQDPESKDDLATLLVHMGRALGFLDSDSDEYLQRSKQSPAVASEVEQQVALRAVARQEKRFQDADHIRNSLSNKGVVVEDNSQGTRWHYMHPGLN